MGWQPESYATVGELTAHVRIGDTADDFQAALALSTASRAIDQRCRRQFGRVPVAEARLYTPRASRNRGGWLVPIDDLMTATDLAVEVDVNGDGIFEAVTSYELRPYNAVVSGRPWTELLIPLLTVPAFFTPSGAAQPAGAVQVTAVWGWSGIPDGVRQACLLQASRLLSRRDSPYGVAGSPEVGSELRLLQRLDPDVIVALEPYRRRVWAA